MKLLIHANTFVMSLQENLTPNSAVATGVEEMVPNHRAQSSDFFTKLMT